MIRNFDKAVKALKPTVPRHSSLEAYKLRGKTEHILAMCDEIGITITVVKPEKK